VVLSHRLDIEAELHHIPVPHHVVLVLGPRLVLNRILKSEAVPCLRIRPMPTLLTHGVSVIAGEGRQRRRPAWALSTAPGVQRQAHGGDPEPVTDQVLKGALANQALDDHRCLTA
jgi:hypothetical protein